MHVAHVYKEYVTDSFGGVQQTIHHLGKALLSRGVKISVITPSKSARSYTVQRFQGITVHAFPLSAEIYSNGISFSAMRHFHKLAQTADILHYHFPWPSGDFLHQFAPRDKPSVVTYHADIVRQKVLNVLYTPLRNRFLGQMDAIVATSPNYIATSPILQRYTDKTHCIPIGLDEKLYPAPPPERLAYWKNTLPPGFFLYVGVLRYYKGLHVLVEAARRTHVPIVIVGFGPLAEELRQQANDIPNLTFLGELSDSDKMALLQLCAAFVFPSHLRSEAFGISLLEAAMTSKPMITCEIGTGTTYVNIKDKTGLVIPPNDAEALHKAIEDLAASPPLRAMFGHAARARFDELFISDVMAQRYHELYETLLPPTAEGS